MLGAGPYNVWLIFQRMPNPESQSETGQAIGVPVTHFETPGEFQPAGSKEFPSAYKRNSEAQVRFRIPYPDVLVDPLLHRIVMEFDEDNSPPDISTWNILGVEAVGGQKFELLVEANRVR
jgi:hypothetical protein